MRVFGITGWKDSGKTTLVTSVVAELRNRGLSVSTIKHAHHEFDVDQPGRDSYRHRHAGAREVLVASRIRWALMHELREEAEPSLVDLLQRLSPVDLVLIEGFKHEAHPKIQVIAPGAIDAPPPKDILGLIGFACEDPAQAPAFTEGKPVLSRDDIVGITDLISSGARDWP